MARIVCLNDEPSTGPLLTSWAEVAAGWIQQGRHPYVFIHSADTFYVPRLGKQFYTHLAQHVELPPLRPIPAGQGQLDLF